MPRKVEQAVGGLVQSLLGSFTKHSLFGGVSGTGPASNQPSLGFLTFVEKAQDACKQSKECERQFFDSCSRSWLEELSRPGCSNSNISDVLQRALVAASRGHRYSQLHIHAVKLAQAANVHHKLVGYLYLSMCCEDSELNVLVTNTLHKDLKSLDALAVLTGLTALSSVLPCDVPPQIIQALNNCLHHPMSLVRRKACQVLYAGSKVWQEAAAAAPESCSRVPDPLLQQLLESNTMASLLQLLSDSDPSVALAATHALAYLYTCAPSELCYVRNSVACSAAYLLTQAFNGALPQHYNTSSMHAPHTQLQMIRVLRMLYSSPTEECDRREDGSKSRGTMEDSSHITEHDYRVSLKVPGVVISSLTSVLTQVWGSGPAGLCMTLLEAIILSMELPHEHTPPGLRSTAINMLLGFIKSSDGKLQYAAVLALADNWPVFCSSVTPALLCAVVQNLHSSSHAILTRTTLKLLHTMANEHNYKSVVSTLVQYCESAGPALQSSIHGQLATIVRQCECDAVWCTTVLHTMVLTHRPAALTSALTELILKGLREEDISELVGVSLGLVAAALGASYHPSHHCSIIAPLLIQLNEKYNTKNMSDIAASRKKTALSDDVNVSASSSYNTRQSTNAAAGFVSSVVSRSTEQSGSMHIIDHFNGMQVQPSNEQGLFNEKDRTILYELNQMFIDKLDLTEYTDKENGQSIFECIKNIGLYNSHLRKIIIQLLNEYKNSANLVYRRHAHDALLWLNNYDLSLKVTTAQQRILNNIDTVDWSMPFLDDYINKSIEDHNEQPYVPFNLTLPRDGASASMQIQCSSDDREFNPVYHASTIANSCYATPRLTIEPNIFDANSISLKNSSFCEPSSMSNSLQCHNNLRREITQQTIHPSPASASSVPPHRSILQQQQLQHSSDETFASLTSSSVPLSTSSAQLSSGSAPPSACSARLNPDTTQRVHTAGSSPGSSLLLPRLDGRSDLANSSTDHLKGSIIISTYKEAPKLLWSIEGRAGDGNMLAATTEGIELGAEAHEALSLPEESDGPASGGAAALAKAIYAGLARK